MHQDTSFANVLILDDLLTSVRWARETLDMTDLDIDVGNGLRIHNLEIPFNILKSKLSGPNNGKVQFNNQERMAMRDYLQHVCRVYQVPMNVIPHAAIRYGRFELKIDTILQLAGSRKSQLLNNVNHNSSWVEFQHSNQGIDTLEYGYVKYYAHILLEDDRDLYGEEGAEEHFLPHIYFQPTEKLDKANRLLIRLANPGRAGRRRC